MAANFYLSSHANFHLHPRSALLAARVEDLRHATEQEIAWIEIWSGSVIQKLCKRLGLRQQVIATAIVYFRRFYLRNAYCDTDCALVAAACCYVAAKAEETPVHVKSVVGEAKFVFHDMGLAFPNDNTKLAEMEFYLIEELDFHLIIFHPYRSLVQLCGRDGGPFSNGELGRQNRVKMLKIEDSVLQMAWFIINDTFRSSLCLIHPPHLIALAAIYLAFSIHPPESIKAPSTGTIPSPTIETSSRPTTRTRKQSIDEQSPTSSTSSSLSTSIGGQAEPITFLSSLQIDHSLVLEIVQDVIALFECWNALENNQSTTTMTLSNNRIGSGKTTSVSADEKVVGILARMMKDRAREVQAEREKGRGNFGGWKK